MSVQDHAITYEGFGICHEAENPVVLRMESACFDERRNGATRFEVRVQTQPRLRPLNTSFELALNELLDPLVADLNERGREYRIRPRDPPAPWSTEGYRQLRGCRHACRGMRFNIRRLSPSASWRISV